VWQSGDPIFGKYLPDLCLTCNDPRQVESEDWNPLTDLPGIGGVFNSANLSLYSYGHKNPLKMFDPDGRSTISITIDRQTFTDKSIVGTITVNNTSFGVTLELPYRANQKDVSSIPAGTHFGKFVNSPTHGPTIEVMVEGRSAILFHIGNRPAESEGCILLGVCAPQKTKDFIQDSGTAFKKFKEFVYKVLAADRATSDLANPTDIIVTIKETRPRGQAPAQGQPKRSQEQPSRAPQQPARVEQPRPQE